MYLTGSRGALLLSAFLPRLGPPNAGGPFFATGAVVTGRRQAAERRIKAVSYNFKRLSGLTFKVGLTA